jgi:sugar lactone lactonase YvrE
MSFSSRFQLPVHRTQKASTWQVFTRGGNRARPALERLEGRDLLASLIIVPTYQKTMVGNSSEPLSPLTAVCATFVPPPAGYYSTRGGMAFDNNGNLYVSDSTENTVSRVTPDGTVTTFVSASAGLSNPYGLAFDKSGNLFVTNAGKNTVNEVTPDGTVTTFVSAFAGLSFPRGLAFDSSGNLYVSSWANNSVSKVTPGGIVTIFVPSSAGLAYPEGMAFDPSDNLYVADTNKITEVTPSGVVTTLVPASAGLSQMKGLVFDSSGNLLVTCGDNSVRKVSPTGVVSTFVPSSAGLATPWALAIDSMGILYVTSAGEIIKVPTSSSTFSVGAADAGKLAAIGLTLNADGTFSGAVTNVPSSNPLSFTALATNEQGDSGSAVISIAVTHPVIGPTSLKIGVGDSRGLPPITVTGQGNELSMILGSGMFEPKSVAFDGSNNMYVSDVGHGNEVLEIAADGTYTLLLSRADFFMDDPLAVACDSKGNLFVAYEASDYPHSYLVKVTPTHQVSIVCNGLPVANGLAVDSSDNIYMACPDDNSVIEFKPDRSIVVYARNLSAPTDVAFDKSGNLFVSNAGNNTVSEIAPDGTISTYVSASAGLSWPSALAFDGGGNLFIANAVSGTVSQVTPDGTVSTLIPSSARLNLPRGLAFDGTGVLTVADLLGIWKLVPAPPTFSVSAADAMNLAAIGLRLNSDGTLSGTVTSLPSPNPLTFTVNMTDAVGDRASAVVTLTVDPTPVITSAANTTFAVGVASSFRITVTGYPTPTLSEVGTLPAGITFDPNSGVLSGTPSAGTGGRYLISFTASNGVESEATQSFTLRVSQTPTITSTGSTTFVAGAAGSFTVTATGFPIPTLSEVGELPLGVSFDASTGLLSGTPAAGTGGSYSIVFTASNGLGSDATQSFTLIVNQAPAFTSPARATFTVGVKDAFKVTVSGFPAPTLSADGVLPLGLSFDASTGVISGEPSYGTARNRAYQIVLTASNGAGDIAVQHLYIIVNQKPDISSAGSTTFVVGTAGAFTVTATGFPIPTLTETGSLPSGVTSTSYEGIYDRSCVLSGTPALGTGGSYPITFLASSDLGGFWASFTILVNEAPTITSANSTTFSVGTAGAFTILAAGFPAPTWNEVGTLPGGVNFDAVTGVLSGTPTTGGKYPITFTASNGVGSDAIQAFILIVNQALAITNSASTTFAVGTASSFMVTAAGFPTPTLGEIGALPKGITFDSNTGILSGTPADGTAGSYPITFKASNGVGEDASQSFTLTVTQVGAISGVVFRDYNLNGLQDGNEPGLANQTVFLDLNHNATLDAGEPTAITNASGIYLFTGLTPATYIVRQMAAGGLLLTAPASGSYSLTLTNGSELDNQNFGQVLTSSAVPLSLPPTTPFPAQGSADADFVEAVYRAVLNRNADQGGLNFWAGGLSLNKVTRLQVVQGIANSPEHFGLEVDAYYQTLLGRTADPGGRVFWVSTLENGTREEQVAASFFSSKEYLSKGEKHFVDAMYVAVLGRPFDQIGEAYWLDALGTDASGNPTHVAVLTHEQVINDFLYSEESRHRLVEGYYEVFLQRPADPPGLHGWTDEVQRGSSFFAPGQNIIASDEFFAQAAAEG